MSTESLWASEIGTGDALVMLHPGGTDSRAMESLSDALPSYRRILIDRAGHGRSRDVAGDWSFEAMADAVADVVSLRADSAVHILGWSDGAIVGLHLALRRPELVRSLVFGGAVFHHSGWLDGVLGGDPPDFMRDSYAEVSPDGVEHWLEVVRKAQALHEQEPALTAGDLRMLACPTLLVVGDDDEVRWEHLHEMYDAVPDAELAVIPRATHGVIIEKPNLLADLVREFHRIDRGDGLAPIRRSGTAGGR